MSTLFVGLTNINVFTVDNARDLRNYISLKYPGMPLDKRAYVFADAVNRIVDNRIPKFTNEQRIHLKELLFKEAISKPYFKIDCSEVFMAAIKLEILGNLFFTELTSWLSKELETPVAEANVFSVVVNTHKMMANFPDMDIAEIISSIDQELISVNSSTSNISKDIYNDDINSEAFSYTLNNEVTVNASGLIFNRNAIKSFAAFIAGISLGKTIAIAGVAGILLSSLFSYNAHNYYGMEKSILNTLSPTSSAVHFNINDVDLLTYEAPPVVTTVIKMQATAYDLSVESCGKLPGEPGYGITFSGTKATVGRTVAVDPEIIPLGSKLFITFPDEYNKMDGIYYAEDTGRLIKGNKVDIFFGEDRTGQDVVYKNARRFGIQTVEIQIMD